jgi:hypothetical protein
MNSVWYKILINVINKEELFLLLFAPTNSRLWVFKKPVHHAASECDMLQVFMCLYWHTRGQHCNASVPGAKSIQARPLMLAFRDPDITINAEHYYGTRRGLYVAIKRKCPSMLVRGVYCTAVPIPTWPILSRTYYTVCPWRCWTVLHTAQTCYCVT